MKKIYDRYSKIINYLIFGFLTTIVSVVSYYVLSLIFNLNNNFWFILANVTSWLLAVSFAYITNRKFVFMSRNKKGIEFIKFMVSRLLTLFLEISGMYILVKLIKLDNMLSKVMIQFIVIVLNYVLSKLLVFNN